MTSSLLARPRMTLSATSLGPVVNGGWVMPTVIFVRTPPGEAAAANARAFE